MNILIIGYGRMGKTIERLAQEAGHNIVARIDQHNVDLLHDRVSLQNLQIAVAIEFSQPDSAVDNILACFKAGIPIVSGTTGWLDQWNEVSDSCQKYNGTLFYASNFSIGVNLFFGLNQWLAQRVRHLETFDVVIEETHHIHKLDSPSGTAISIAEDIIKEIPAKNTWVNHDPEGPEELEIYSIREGEIPGIHSVTYTAPHDILKIRHEALSRDGFARGAVKAAEWVCERKGIFNMNHLLNL